MMGSVANETTRHWHHHTRSSYDNCDPSSNDHNRYSPYDDSAFCRLHTSVFSNPSEAKEEHQLPPPTSACSSSSSSFAKY